jgi:hypothetical protein
VWHELRVWAAGASLEDAWLLTLVLAAAMLACLWFGLGRLRRARLIEDTPTARIRSAHQGYVEFEGRARMMPGPPIFSPLTRTPCVWWRFRVERRKGYGTRSAAWSVVESYSSDDMFLLDDGTGECVVDPQGARVHPSLRRTWYGSTQRPMWTPQGSRRFNLFPFGTYRYSELLIGINTPLHVMGFYRTHSGAPVFDEAADVRELIAQWKREPEQLLKRFDANGDGEICMQEWQAVRKAAAEEVRRRHVDTAAAPDVSVVSRPRDGRPFLLSAVPQATLVRRKKWTGWPLVGLAIYLGAVMVVVWESRLGG